MAQAAHGRASRARAQPDRHAGLRDEGARHGSGVRRDKRHAEEGHARPRALGRGIAAAGQNAAAAKEKAEEDAAYEGLKARQEQDRIDAEKQAKDEMEEALRAANHYWGGSWHSRGTLQCSWYGCGRLLYGGVRRYDPRVLPQQGQYQVRVDKEGITRVYDAARNLFGAYNPDGTTKSYLAPTGGQAYFDNQGWTMP